MAFHPMDFNADGRVDFTDFMIFNSCINPGPDPLVSRVAQQLACSPNDSIGDEEFRGACHACGADPDSFTPADYRQLQRELDELG